MVGQFNGTHFISEAGPVTFQYGNCFYASQTFNNIPSSDGRRIQMAWGQVGMPGMPFNQMILFPVTLTLRTAAEGIRMYAEPVSEIETLHQQQWHRSDLTVAPGDNPLSGISGQLFHIKADLKPQGAQTIRFVIRGVPVAYDVQKQQLTCLGKSAPLKLAEGKIRLEILVDRMSIEIYGNGGLVYMPLGVNLTDNANALELLSDGGDTRIEGLDVYPLNSIWN